jgi:hypothetical protein
MPDREATARGLAFEARVSEALSLDLTRASGNQPHDRSDERGRGLRGSCKSTSGRSWAQTRRELAEAIELALGTGQTPFLAVEDDDGAAVVMLRLEDFAEVLKGERKPLPLKRSERIRALARTPLLLRPTEALDG